TQVDKTIGKHVVPAGSYYASCDNIHEEDGVLYAHCKIPNNDAYKWPAKLEGYEKCHGDIMNAHGNLVCAYPAPGGSYQKTCDMPYLDDGGVLYAWCESDSDVSGF